jgi:hypothetical protein
VCGWGAAQALLLLLLRWLQRPLLPPLQLQRLMLRPAQSCVCVQAGHWVMSLLQQTHSSKADMTSRWLPACVTCVTGCGQQAAQQRRRYTSNISRGRQMLVLPLLEQALVLLMRLLLMTATRC